MRDPICEFSLIAMTIVIAIVAVLACIAFHS